MKKYSGFPSFNKLNQKMNNAEKPQTGNPNVLGELLKAANSLNFGGQKVNENTQNNSLPPNENSIPQNLRPNNKLVKIMAEHDQIVKEIEKREKEKNASKFRKKK